MHLMPYLAPLATAYACIAMNFRCKCGSATGPAILSKLWNKANLFTKYRIVHD